MHCPGSRETDALSSFRYEVHVSGAFKSLFLSDILDPGSVAPYLGFQGRDGQIIMYLGIRVALVSGRSGDIQVKWLLKFHGVQHS